MRRLLTPAQPEGRIKGVPVTADGRPVFVVQPGEGVTIAEEVESEMKALSWPRLMVAGGVAGVSRLTKLV
jgi:hypothetical protein